MQTPTNRLLLPIILLLLTLPVAACVVPVPADPTAPPGVVATDAANGFCFHLPTGYTTAHPTSGTSLTVYAPDTSAGHRERVFVEVDTTGTAPLAAADVATWAAAVYDRLAQ